MGRLKIRKKNEKNIIWKNVRFYIDFLILICCLIVTFNIRPVNDIQSSLEDNNVSEKSKMIYIFHDYEWNEYVLNDTIHGAAGDWSYLFEDKVPESVKWDTDSTTDSLSLEWIEWKESEDGNNNDIDQDKNDMYVVKDNQVSSQDIFSDLWIVENPSWNEYNVDTWNENMLIINLSNPWWNNTKYEKENDDNYYIKTEITWDAENNALIIEKIDNSGDYDNLVDNSEDYKNLTGSAKVFSFTSEWWILPILIPWDELQFGREWMQTIGYIDNLWTTGKGKDSGITIIDDYADCMTPWWYKIVHWDSVLAYKQMDNAPDICNIERRFCRNGKLSWTYTQQWCSINKNYTYEQRWEAVVHQKKEQSKSSVVQNSDWSVTVNKPLWTWSFVFDKPSQSSTPEYHVSDNVRDDDEVDQTKRARWNCTAPWGEEVKHWQFVQAFKHSNWFSDAPCVAQIRLCTMWDLMWTYTQYSCKTWDTSLIDWINWSPTRDSFSEEKLEWVRKQIKTEEKNYNNARKNVKQMINSNTPTDEILSILDDN